MKILRVLVWVVVFSLLPLSSVIAQTRSGDWAYEVSGNNATITKYYGNDEYLQIPETLDGIPVTTIGSGVFDEQNKKRNEAGLVTITFPDSVTVIENNNFVYCTNLVMINLNEGLKSIGNNCFTYCTSLSSLLLPSTTSGLGHDLFDGSGSLVVEVYPGTVGETYCKIEKVPYKLKNGNVGEIEKDTTASGRTASEAKQYPFPELFEFQFKRGQMLDVYSGPGKSYYRAVNGRAAASTSGQIFPGAWEGDWLLLKYGTTSNGTRHGYVHRSDFEDYVVVNEALFARWNVTINKACKIGDGSAMKPNDVTAIKSGTPAIYLAYSWEQEAAYVEVETDLGLMRGFVPFDCIGF